MASLSNISSSLLSSPRSTSSPSWSSWWASLCLTPSRRTQLCRSPGPTRRRTPPRRRRAPQIGCSLQDQRLRESQREETLRGARTRDPQRPPPWRRSVSEGGRKRRKRRWNLRDCIRCVHTAGFCEEDCLLSPCYKGTQNTENSLYFPQRPSPCRRSVSEEEEEEEEEEEVVVPERLQQVVFIQLLPPCY